MEGWREEWFLKRERITKLPYAELAVDETLSWNECTTRWLAKNENFLPGENTSKNNDDTLYPDKTPRQRSLRNTISATKSKQTQTSVKNIISPPKTLLDPPKNPIP